LTAFVREQYSGLLGDGFVAPALAAYGDMTELRGDAAKM
jgi:hypothetical protein